MEIKKLQKSDINDIYTLLEKQDFPNLPLDKKQATLELLKPNNHAYVGLLNDKVILFLCFCERNAKLYFDIACAKGFERKWANKQVLKFIFKTAFKDLAYQEFFVESFTVKARKVVEKFGFEKVINYCYKISSKSSAVLKYFKTKN
jgi:hypothetical protein